MLDIVPGVMAVVPLFCLAPPVLTGSAKTRFAGPVFPGMTFVIMDMGISIGLSGLGALMLGCGLTAS